MSMVSWYQSATITRRESDGVLELSFGDADCHGNACFDLGVKSFDNLSISIDNSDYDDPEDGKPVYEISVGTGEKGGRDIYDTKAVTAYKRSKVRIAETGDGHFRYGDEEDLFGDMSEAEARKLAENEVMTWEDAAANAILDYLEAKEAQERRSHA